MASREDYDRFYNLFVKEVRDGKLGRYTLVLLRSITVATIKEVKEQLATLMTLTITDGQVLRKIVDLVYRLPLSNAVKLS